METIKKVLYSEILSTLILLATYRGSWTGKHLGEGRLSNNKYLIENYIDKNEGFRPLQFLQTEKVF